MKNIIVIMAFLTFCLSLNWTMRTQLVVESSSHFSQADSDKLSRVVSGVEKVINSDEFKEAVYSFEYNGKKQFVDNDGKTNEEIFAVIMAGKERLTPEMDFKWNLNYRIGPLGNNVIAQTSPSIKTVTLNSLKYYKFLDSNFAGTICHEQLHKLGFDHSFNNNSARPYSVPYGIGTLCTKLYRQLVNDDTPAKIPYCGVWCRVKKII